MATDKRPSLDEIFGTTTSPEKPINTVVERPSLDEIFGPSDEKKELPKTNEWGEPIYPFEKPVEVEGARLNDFLTPTIFEQKPNAKSEAELPKAIKEDKPYNPEGLLPIAKPGPAEMPQSFTSPKVFEEYTPEEKLMLDVDKATDNAFNAAQEEATKQMVTERKERGTFGVMNEFGEGVAEKIAYRQSTGADAVIKRTFESISADDINTIIEERVANNEEFKAKKQAFDDEVKRIMPNSNDNFSDAEIEALFANMTPEEREAAEKQIAETTQALEALQAQFATDVEGIYKSESKDVEAQINNRIINRLAKLNLPKNDLEYIGKAIYNNSLVGTLYEIGLNAAAGGSGTDYIVSQQALAQAKPSAIAKVVGGAGAILADGAIFGALGAGGSLAGVGVRELATKVVAGQIARKAAVSATNSAVKATARRIVEKNVLQQFASSAAAQAVTLGGYNGLLTAAQETLSPTGENGAYNWRNILTRFGEGLLTGIALGGVSVGTSAAKGAMYRARPDMAYTATGMAADLGVSLAGFTAENAAFLGIGSIVSGEEITAEAIGESFATLGLLKGIGALKRVAKGEKLMQQPDFVERTISDLKFTKEEMDAMRKAGVDMEAMDFISLAVTEMNNVPYTESRRSVINAYNTVMASREIPTSAKVKLKYIVTGEVPRVVGPSRAEVVEAENGIEVRTYDYQDRVVQIRPFETAESATKFVSRIQPLLERNTIVDGAKTLRGADSLIAVDRAIDEYMQTGEYFAEREKAYGGENTGSKLPAKTPLGKEALMREMRIYLGIEPGTLPEGAESRIARIVAIAKNVYQDSVSALQKQVAKQHGATVSELLHAINVKPDLRTVRESQLVKAYVNGLKQFNESMSGPIEAEQARYAEQIRPQIEQGKREVEDAERETAFVRESLNEAAKRMATDDGKQIAIVRLATGEQVAVYKGRIVIKDNGAIDTEASENTVVIKRIDAEGNEVRSQVGIGEIAEVVEFSTPEAAVEESMSVVEAQAAKKLTLDNAIAERGEQGVEVVTIDGNSGKIVGIDENGAYILRAKGESGKEVDVPVSINDIAEINTEQPAPATTEQMAVADATEKVVEAGLATDMEVEYDDDFPPLTEEDMVPALDPDKIKWEELNQEDYTNASAIIYGDAETLSSSHTYYSNSRGKLQAAQRKVAEQQKVIDKLNSRFATLSSPAEAQKLRKQVATAEQEKAKREQTVKNIEQQMAKYAYAMKKYGVEVATENDLLAEREKLNAERAALVEADKELNQAEADAEKNIKKTIPNTEANRKYIEQLYADRFGVSPAQAGPRQAILWDLANGAIKLRWDNATTDSGAVQRGLQAELGVRGTEERRAYKAVIDNKNGQSVDAYVHDLWQSGEWGQEISTEELKDELLGVLQSTPNGSLALKGLLDMSGVQADLEAQISLGKGDIQRKLEEVDANLAKNAQQMADFRKRINDAVQKLESGEQLIIPVGEGEFGPIYDQFRGKPQEAVNFLLEQKNGEAIGALTHPEIGDVSLVYGNEFAGLEKIAQKHPEVLNDLQNVLSQMSPIMESANRIKLESPSHFAVVSKEYMGAPRDKWLLTAYEKKSSASNNRMDTDGTVTGRRNDTATSQDTTYSENKDTTTIPKNQISEKETATDYRKKLLENARSVVEKKYGFEMARLPKMLEQAFADGNQGEIKRLQNIFSEYVSLFGTDAAPIMDVTLRQMKSAVGTEKYKERKNKEKSKTPAHQAYDSLIRTVQNWLKNNTPANEDIPFMIEQKPADKGVVSEAEQNFEREVFDAFAGHLGETLGAESVVTDAAEANRVLEWHQAVGERLRTAIVQNAEVAAERAEIERVAKENGTWLKAPNGKDTNLTERQWVDVRTPNFRGWAGNWEKAIRIDKLRTSGSIDVIFSGQYELTRKGAKEWMRNNIKGEYVNKDTNEHITVSNVGINEVTSHGSQNAEHLKSLSAIPQMIEGSIFIDELPNNKNHDKYDSYRYYVCGLKIDGVDYTAKIVVGVKGDSKYYDHRLTEIEKGSLIDNLNGLSNSVADNQDSLVSVSKDTKLKELLQINSSKVVDANGEPMVVYHGTPNQFNTFNRELIGSSTDRGIWGRGFYFTSNKAEAERYTKRGDVTGEVKEVFLNIRKPLAIKAEQDDAGKEYIQSLYRKYVTDEIFEDPRTTEAKLAEATQKVTDELVENGYDGVIVTYKDGTQEYVVFNPNQIKSATENTGEYSPANDDIRMSIAAYHGSGADFEKFDLSFIGTGEGAQAYGHGIYVTTRKGIAKNYADTIGGTIQQERRHEAQQNLLRIRKKIADNNQDIEKRKREIQQMQNTYAELKEYISHFNEEEVGGKTRYVLDSSYIAADEAWPLELPIPKPDSVGSYLTYEEARSELQKLQEEIDSTQALIDLSKARVEKLKPLEEAADKEWQAMEAPDKIRKLNTQIELHEANLKSQQISIAAMQQRAKIKQAEYDYYNEQLAELESKYGVNSPEYKEYVFKNDYIESEYKDLVKYIEDTKVSSGYLEKMISDEKAELARAKEIQKPFRNLYTVEVPDNTGDNYLSWDKIVPNDIIDRLDKAIEQQFGEDVVGKANLKYGQLGQQMYLKLANALSSDKAASEFLHSLGFVGIEYPAQYTTGGRADGAKNYVIFNADDVKIVDHVQYFKTPNGEVYGFVYEDKIYLDPTNIDPKAPVHEYTELWCREVAKANEALWKRGKELVKQTKVWEEVNADENYKNQSEDLRASEAWSRIIADEMMGKAREYGSKGLMAKLRGWLRSFWKTVKSVVGKWTKKDLDDLTVDQFKKMTMADFINKVDPRKWNAKKPKEVSKSLVGIHNISLDKLQKALKQGGLANPSAAVIDIAKQNHEGYGEYSLIMPKSLVDATSGRNAGTFTGDAWTPTYPTIVRQLDTKGWEIVKNKISTAVGDSKELYADIVNGVRNFLEDNRSSKLEYVFLKEKGIEPVVQYKGADGFVGIANLEAILGVSNITEGIEAYKRYQNAKPIYRYDFNRWASVNGNKAEFAKLKAQIKENPALKKDVDADLSFAQFDSFVNGIYKKEREAGNIDTSNTLLSASIYVDKNGLREEFESWIDTLMESAEAKEVFYAGIDRNGDRIYKPNTLENVSRHMLTEGMQNAYNNGGLSATKATLLQRLTTLSEIRQNKDRLSDEGKYSKEFDKLSDRLFNIITAISDMQKISSNRFMNIDYAELRLQDALAKRDPIAYLNKEYGYNIEKDSDLAKEIKSFIGDVRRMPAKYFETKFERPVMFNEFAAVVAPDTMPESVEQQLRDAGLAIYKYNPDVEGDRRKATLAATASKDIRFMIIGEKGAAALDQAEEATSRLDNLAVAREMEEANRDAKAIKLATGWERGADGKWRYEIPDFKLKSDTALVKNVDNQIVTTLGEVIDDEALFTAYPELRKLSVVSLPNQEYGGHYQDGSIMPHIALGNKLFTPSTKRLVELEKEFDKDMTSEQEDALMSEFNAEVERAVAQPEFYTLVTSAAKKVLVHEVQHAIQRIEGFARGGSWEIERPDNDAEMLRLREAVRGARAYIDHFNGGDIAMAIRDGKKYNYLEWRTISPESQQILLEYLGRKRKVDYADFRAYLDNAHKMTLPKQYGMAGYRKFAGEVESKNAEARMYMTPEERRATLLSETEDVAREDQIFLESNLGVAQSVEVSESVEAPTRKPRKSAAEKSLEKIESLREQLKNKKRSLNDTLLDVYNFLTSKDIAETMGEGVGKAHYRRVIKNSIEAIRKAYDVTDAEEKRKTIFKYLGEIDDSLSQLLTRQRLNEVTDILDKAIYGYTAQGVRTGKRIDEHTREIFDILRNAIGEPVEEERDDSGRRKPVRYRLKNRTEAGDITSSFRLRSLGNNEGVIAKLRSEADDIIASADELDTATTRAAAQLEYASNLLSLYDNALQLNEAIGQTTDEIADIQREIERTNEQYKVAATGSEEKKNLYKMRQKLQNDLEAEQMNRAALRHRYASILKTFTTSLEELDEKGAGDFARAEMAKAEQAVKWRRGIYNSIKNPNAPVLPVEDHDRQGKEVKVNWKGLNTRAKINESAFMATFAEMSRDIDINSIPGQWAKDGWYYQFMLSEGGYMARTDWRYKQEKAFREELDAEVLKLSGDKKADEPYKLFAQLAQEPSGLVIPRLSVGKNKEGKTVGGYQDNIPLSIGQILYMRNAIRQTNGFAGYLAWGIPEEDMKKIAQYAEANYPKYCRFFDWVVSEFMPKLYEMQDAIYFEKFGTHLPKTAFYFPFVRDKRMVGKVAEVGEGEVSLPSSVTGNIVERVKTSAKMDLQADAFSVLQDHIKETLDWCAYVELTDKFNSVGTSHAFGNMLKAQGVSVQKLKEMYEVAVGQSKINSTDNTTLTKTLNAISKGLVAGNIVLNPNAAIKQIVSATATLGYSANPKLLAIWAKNFFVPSVIKTGIGKVVEKMKSGDIDPVEAIDWKVVGDNWKWAIENIPTLRERWEGREAGFEVLKSHSFDSWDKLTAMITNAGLAPNAFVDMLTCSNAAKTVYEYEYPRLLERGRSEEEAHREACVKAAIFVNETQQSSLNGFLSSFQSGGGLQRILGVGLGAYQNSSMAFARNERFALTNMLRMANSSTRNDMQMRQVEAYKELGIEEQKATKLAKQDISESYGQQIAGFVHNGVLNNYIWKIAGVLLGSLASAGFAAMFDKEEWNKLWKNEKFRQELASAVSAETLLWQTPLFYNAPITKQILEYSHNVAEGKAYGGIFESPTSQSAQDFIDAIFEQWVGVTNKTTSERERKEPTRYDRSAEWLVASTLIKAGLGVNPDLVVRMAQGIDDMMKDGVQVEDVMATLASPRGITRAIAGEPRPGESKQEYLDRMSYIYRQVNAGSGDYDKKFVSERTKEYIDNKDNKLYRELGIVPREVRMLEQKAKAIRKQLQFFDKSDEGMAEFKALPETERKQQIEIAKRYDKVFNLTRKMNQGILPFDEEGMRMRKDELQQRYEMLKQVYDMWIEYNNK